MQYRLNTGKFAIKGLKSMILFLVIVVIALSPDTMIASAPENSQIYIQDDSLTLKEIKVFALYPQILHYPYSSLSQQDLSSKGNQTVADALESMPGVNLTRDGAWATGIQVRGLDDSKLLTLFDGARALTGTDLSGILSTASPDLIDHVELVKGAASVLYGSDAMGGIVNIIPYRPSFNDAQKISGKISLGYQSANDLKTTSAQIKSVNQDWYLMGSGSYRTAGNTMTPEGEIANSQFNDASWDIAGGKRLEEGQELQVNYNHHEAWNVGLPGGDAFPATAVAKYTLYRRDLLKANYIWRNISDLIPELRVSAYDQQIFRNVENKVNSAKYIYPSSKNQITGVKADADLYFNDYQNLTVGVDGWYRSALTARLNVSLSPDTIEIGEKPVPDATMLDIGVFGYYKLVLDPHYWTLSLGVRVDNMLTRNEESRKQIFKNKISNDKLTELDPDNTLLFASGQRNELNYALHADLDFKPTKNQEVILRISNAYRVASLEERFKYIDLAGKLRAGNPDLKPESLLGADLHYSYQNSKLTLFADFYGNYLHNLITEKEGIFYMGDGTARNAWVNTNVESALIYGSELKISWLPVNWMSLSGNMSLTRTRDMMDGVSLPMAPPTTFTVDLAWIPSEKWQVCARGRTASADPVGEDPYRMQVVDLFWNVSDIPLGIFRLKADFGVRNLLDASYTEYFSTLRGINQLEAGRNAFVRAEFQF